MALSDGDRARQIAANEQEYGAAYRSLRWLSEPEARAASDLRQEVMAQVSRFALTGYKGTKLDCRNLSPGCRICGQGDWSCLFVNGQCNGRCFYCPTPQDEVGEPTTNTVSFSDPEDYADYVEAFGFRGVSISGGEPLVTLERTLSYLHAVKKRFGDRVYLWMYTNGTLLTPAIVQRLHDASLDEIRVDIGAVRYDLKKAEMAIGAISCVTVEIPAIPEDEAVLKQKIAEMQAIGIDHLNLHQLRLTPHNYRHLAERNYTFLHGEKVTVLESERTALNLMKYAFEQGLALPINYCAFVYKNRFQGAAARRRNAGVVKADFEDVTENGYIRRLGLSGRKEDVVAQIDRFERLGRDQALWSSTRGADRLSFSASLWRDVDFENLAVTVAYFEAALRSSMSYRNVFREVSLNSRRRVVVERRKVGQDIVLTPGDVPGFGTFLEDGAAACDSGKWRELRAFECIESGLQDYF